jgi:hypothetical protein
MLGVYFFVLLLSSGESCVPSTPSNGRVLLQFAVCFSILQGSLVLEAAFWFRR